MAEASLYPAAKLCIAKAIKFLPKLQKCLALQAAEARAAGEPDLDHDLDFRWSLCYILVPRYVAHKGWGVDMSGW